MEETTNEKPKKRYLLILQGFGDWPIRRVLISLIRFYNDNDNDDVEVVVIDLYPLSRDWDTLSYEEWVDVLDRWIVRRQIEQAAEILDAPLGDAFRGISLLVRSLAVDPTLPNPADLHSNLTADQAIGKFLDDYCDPILKAAYEECDDLRTMIEERLEGLRGSPRGGEHIGRFVTQVEDVARRLRDRFIAERNQFRAFLSGTLTRLDGVCKDCYRYWRLDPTNGKICAKSTDGKSIVIKQNTLAEIKSTRDIEVYCAIPPQFYPAELERWAQVAGLVVLEKPVAAMIEPVRVSEIKPLAPEEIIPAKAAGAALIDQIGAFLQRVLAWVLRGMK